MRKFILSLAALAVLALAIPFAVPANAQVAVVIGHHHHHHDDWRRHHHERVIVH